MLDYHSECSPPARSIDARAPRPGTWVRREQRRFATRALSPPPHSGEGRGRGAGLRP